MNKAVKKQQRGFTLIELLIVVAVIGILASVILVGLRGFREAGRDSRRIQDLTRMKNALELFFNKCSFYPGSATAAGACDISADPTNWGVLETTLRNARIQIEAIPHDPLSGGTAVYPDYEYAVSADNLRYALKAQLEDPNNAALQNDLDGNPATVNTIAVTPNLDCDDTTVSPAKTNYCVGF